MITKPHYHIITWRDSKNFGKVTKCPSKNCCMSPAYDNDEFPDEIVV